LNSTTAKTAAAAAKSAAAIATAAESTAAVATAAGTTRSTGTTTCATWTTGGTSTARTASATNNGWFTRQQTFPLHLLTRQFARAANGFGLLANPLFRWLFEVVAELHLPENTLTLHLLLERLESLVDVVVANENLHAGVSFRVE
jgi:hypothetical protein